MDERLKFIARLLDGEKMAVSISRKTGYKILTRYNDIGLYPESLVRETGLEALLMDLGFGPDEGLGIFVIGLDEGIDVLPELFDRGE